MFECAIVIVAAVLRQHDITAIHADDRPLETTPTIHREIHADFRGLTNEARELRHG